MKIVVDERAASRNARLRKRFINALNTRDADRLREVLADAGPVWLVERHDTLDLDYAREVLQRKARSARFAGRNKPLTRQQ